MISTGAVLEKVHSPLVVRDLNMLNCHPGQVHVRMLMAGLCGAQLQEARGEKGAEHIPHLIGHEGCGIIHDYHRGGESRFKRGQKVVLHWREGEGNGCNGTSYFTFPDGSAEDRSVRIGAGPVHTFATRVVVSENRCTPVPDDTPPELCCLLGCALSTALACIENDAKLRIGESFGISGMGGVGRSLLYAGTAIGALYEQEGSTDCMFDTTGNGEQIESCIDRLNPGGRLILIGQPAPGAFIRIPYARRLFDGTGATIIASQGGQFNPTKDIPRYVKLWRAGLLQWEPIVSHRYPLSEVNTAMDLLRTGTAGRILLDCAEDLEKVRKCYDFVPYDAR